MNREQLLSRTFVDLADSLVDDFDLVDMMVRLTERVVELTHASAVGLLLLDGRGTLQLMAATSDVIETVELFQIQKDEGPCRDCCHKGSSVIADDLVLHRERWPSFVPVSLAAGYLGVHAFPLRLRGSVLGALGVFRSDTGGLGPDDVALTQALADVATIAILQFRAVSTAQAVATQLQQALDSRIVIEQAKGILAVQAGIDMDQAFRLLRDYARNHQMRLTDVATDVTSYVLTAESLSP